MLGDGIGMTRNKICRSIRYMEGFGMNAASAGYGARDLAKVGVESSNLFARSNFL